MLSLSDTQVPKTILLLYALQFISKNPYYPFFLLLIILAEKQNQVREVSSSF